jgi:hypothetical protein
VLVDDLGVSIFGAGYSNSFFNLLDGDEYPCGNNYPTLITTGNPKCYIFHGEMTMLNNPTSVIMVDFSYSGSIIKARLLFNNPDLNNVWLNVNVRAYSGTQNKLSIYGNEFAGYWKFPNIFRTISSGSFPSGYYNSGSSYFYPNKGAWRDSTSWYLNRNTPGFRFVPVGGYMIL